MLLNLFQIIVNWLNGNSFKRLRSIHFKVIIATVSEKSLVFGIGFFKIDRWIIYAILHYEVDIFDVVEEIVDHL